MKHNKYTNFIPFLDFLFCVTLTYVSLFVLSITQIRNIEIVKKEEINSLNTKNKNLIKSIDELNKNIQLITEESKELKSSLDSSVIKNTALTVVNDDLKNKIKILEKEKETLQNQNGNWKTTAKIAIEVTWPKEIKDDIDIYILTPDKRVVYFNNQVGPGVFIDRDDLGYDEFENKHIEIANFFRLLETNTQPYLINLHSFTKRTKTPTPVTLKLFQINESNSQVIYEKTFNFIDEQQVESVFEIYTKRNEKNIVEFDKIEDSVKLIPNLVENAKKFKNR